MWPYISTHAPLAGRDSESSRIAVDEFHISTHAPLAGRDVPSVFILLLLNLLISTHAPLAGRDDLDFDRNGYLLDFNPRAPCGARRWCNGSTSVSETISTHAPLAGRDLKN